MTYPQHKQLLYHQIGRNKEQRDAFFTNISCLLSNLTMNDDTDGHIESKIIIKGDFNTVIKDYPEFLYLCKLHKLVDIHFAQNKARDFATFEERRIG